MSDLVNRLLCHGHEADPALETGAAGRISYGQLRARLWQAAARLRATPGWTDGAPVAFLAPPGHAYVETLLGIFCAGGVAIPLSPVHTTPEISHVLQDAAPRLVLATAYDAKGRFRTGDAGACDAQGLPRNAMGKVQKGVLKTRGV